MLVSWQHSVSQHDLYSLQILEKVLCTSMAEYQILLTVGPDTLCGVAENHSTVSTPHRLVFFCKPLHLFFLKFIRLLSGYNNNPPL